MIEAVWGGLEHIYIVCVCLFIDRLVRLPPEIAQSQRVWSKNRRRCHVCGRLDLVHSKVNINKADKNAL